MATARVSIYNGNDATLYVDIDEWIISKWTENEIQAENDNAACVTYTLSIFPMKKEAFSLTVSAKKLANLVRFD